MAERNRFIPLHSTIPNAIPTASGMFEAELAVNIHDRRLFMRSGSAIVELASAAPATASIAAIALTATTASYALTASVALNASAEQSVSSSWASSSISSSYSSLAGSVDFGNVLNKPTLISSSTQINTGSFTGSFVGTFTGTASFATSATTASHAITARSASYSISSSYASIAPYSGLTGVPSGIYSSSAQLPSGLVSSSVQINTGSFTGSFIGIHTGSLFGTASVANAISFTPFTASYSVTSSAATSITFVPATASHAQAVDYIDIAGKPTLISSSVQINTGSFTGSFVGTLTGTASFATTSSAATSITFTPTTASYTPTASLSFVHQWDRPITASEFSVPMRIQITTGSRNIVIGDSTTLQIASSSTDTIAIGTGVMPVAAQTRGDVAIGYRALYNYYDDITLHSAKGYHVAIGHRAMYNLKTSSLDYYNPSTAIGQTTLFNVTEGDGNVAIGYNAGGDINGKLQGSVIIGARAYAVGASNLREIFGLVAIGWSVGSVKGDYNTFIGNSVANSVASGSNNTLIGSLAFAAGGPNKVITNTTLIGSFLGYNIPSQSYVNITAIGSAIRPTNSSVLVGVNVGSYLSTAVANSNVLIGNNILYGGGDTTIESSSGNTAVGYQALYSTHRNYNVAMGYNAFVTAPWVEYSVAIGSLAGQNDTSGSNNIWIGYDARAASAGTTWTNLTMIGAGLRASASNAIILGNNQVAGFGVTAPIAKVHIRGETATQNLFYVENNSAVPVLLLSGSGRGFIYIPLQSNSPISASGFSGSGINITGIVTSSYATSASAATSITFTPATASFATTSSAATSITFTPTSASYAVTASWAKLAERAVSSSYADSAGATGGGLTGGGTQDYIAKYTGTTTLGVSKLIETSIGLTVSESVEVSGSITASAFKGSGAQITGVISSSFATTASAATSITFVPTTASYAVTASFASNVTPTISSSWASNSISSSYASVAPYSGLTGVPSGIISSSTQLPSGLVSSSVQINTGSFTGSFVGTFTGTASYATTAGTANSLSFTPSTASYAISSSAATSITFVPATASHAQAVDYIDIIGKPTLVSSSTQINTGSFTGSFIGNLTGTASYASVAPYSGLTGVPVGIYSSSAQLPSGLVSSSTQINTGSFTGSFVGTLTGTASVANAISFTPPTASYAITSSAATSITFVPATASFATSASWARSASAATSITFVPATASFSTTASAATAITFTPTTASYATTASAATSITFVPVTASYTITASYADSARVFPYSGSAGITGSLTIFTGSNNVFQYIKSASSTWYSASWIDSDGGIHGSSDLAAGSIKIYSRDALVFRGVHATGFGAMSTTYFQIGESATYPSVLFTGQSAATMARTGMMTEHLVISQTIPSTGSYDSLVKINNQYRAAGPRKVLVLSGEPSQSLNIQEWQTFTNKILAYVDASGSFSATGSVSSSLGFKGDGSQITGIITSSFATTSSAATSITFTPVTSSYAVTASWAKLAERAISSSYADSAGTTGGGLTGNGSQDYIAKYTGTTTLGVSKLIETTVGLVVSESIEVSGSVTASAFKGDGAQVTGIISSSYATTSSYATVAQNVLGSIPSASFATTASAATSITFTPQSSSYAETSSLSFAHQWDRPITASELSIPMRIRITTGSRNIVIGDSTALQIASSSTDNVVIGVGAIPIAPQVRGTIAIGYRTLYSYNDDMTVSSDKGYHVAIGYQALYNLQTSSIDYYQPSVAIGKSALTNITHGDGNVAIGFSAGSIIQGKGAGITIVGGRAASIGTNVQNISNLTSLGWSTGAPTGPHNVLIGAGAGASIVTGSYNTIIGSFAFNAGGNKAVSYVTAVGYGAGYNVASGSYSSVTIVGAENGITNNSVIIGNRVSRYLDSVVAGYNVLIGNDILYQFGDTTIVSASRNVAVGYQALFSTHLNDNVAIGYQAFGGNNTSPWVEKSVAIGAYAGQNDTSGSNNIWIGYDARATSAGTTWTNLTMIGAGLRASASNAIILGNSQVAGFGTTAPLAKVDIKGQTATQDLFLIQESDSSRVLLVSGSGQIFVYHPIVSNSPISASAFSGSIASSSYSVTALSSSNATIANTALRLNYVAATGSIAIGDAAVLSGVVVEGTQGQDNIGIGDSTTLSAANNKAFNVIAIGAGAASAITSGSAIAIGKSALLSLQYHDGLSGGDTPIAIGKQALYSYVSQSMSPTANPSAPIAIGGQALYSYKSQSGADYLAEPIAIGTRALFSQIGGGGQHAGNIAIGHRALDSVKYGYANVAIGNYAGGPYGGGDQNWIGNFFMGHRTGQWFSVGNYNVVIGSLTAILLRSGSGNVFLGNDIAARATGTAVVNNGVSIGYQSSYTTNWTGSCANFVAIGYSANAGYDSVAIGYGAGDIATSYDLSNNRYNVWIGEISGRYNSGSSNAAIGYYALGGSANLASQRSVALGYQAGTFDNGTDNIWIGYDARAASLSTYTNTTLIGSGLRPSASNTIILGSNTQNAGFGTTAPLAKVDIKGQTATQDLFLIQESDASRVLLVSGSGRIYVYHPLESNAPITASGFSGSGVNVTGVVTASYAVSSSWAPGGQGSVGPGTTDYIPIFTTTTTIGNSILSQSGAPVQVDVSGSMNVIGNVTANTFVETSALRYKTNITELDSQLSKLTQLVPVSFDYKESGKHSIGLIAEDVVKLYPELVSDDVGGVNYSRMTSILIKSVQELKSIVDRQQKEIDELRKKNGLE